MTWHDDGVELIAEISTSGTYITPPMRVEYPFTGNSANPPDGWIRNFTTGQLNQYAVYNTSNGTFAFSSSPTNPHVSSAYAISREFTVTPGHTYLVTVDVAAQTDMQGSAPILQIGLIRTGETSPYRYLSNNEFLQTGMPDYNYHEITMNLRAESDVNKFIVFLQGRTANGKVVTPSTPPWGVYFRDFVMTDVTTAEAPTFTWREVQCDAMEATIRFGRARFTERYDVGTFSIMLNNVSGEYMYQDVHPWGLRPGRMFRLRARYNGTVYPLCFGVIDRIATFMDPKGKATVNMTVFDTTSYTSDTPTPNIWYYNPSTINDPNSKSGSRIHALLNVAGIAQSLRNIDPGVFAMMNIDQSGRGLREEIGVTSDSEGGSFFGERDGTMVYRDRTWSSRDPRGGTVQANFTAFPSELNIGLQPDDVPTDPAAPVICPHTMDTDWSLERVINAIALAVVGSSRRFYNNQPSQQEYGIRTYQRLDFLNWSGFGYSVDTQLQMRANDIFSTSLEAMLRVKRLSYRPRGANWEFTFTMFLDWLIRVFYYIRDGSWGFATVVRIQSIEHRITPTDWVVSMDVDQPISYTDELNPLPPGGWDVAEWDAAVWDDELFTNSALWSAGFKWGDPTSKWGE